MKFAKQISPLPNCKSLIDGSCSVDQINCSLVIPINRQMQSDDGVSDVLFRCCIDIVKDEGDIK